jgi:hypothetical protein
LPPGKPGVVNLPRPFFLGTIVPVPNPVPTCAKASIFGLSPPGKCGYIEKAQRFLTTTVLN